MSDPALCWRSEEACRVYQRDIQPHLDRITTLEASLSTATARASELEAEVAVERSGCEAALARLQQHADVTAAVNPPAASILRAEL
jgi:hypothetical protein